MWTHPVGSLWKEGKPADLHSGVPAAVTLSDCLYVDLSLPFIVRLFFFILFLSACKYHIPISVTRISPHPEKPDFATWRTLTENVILQHVYAYTLIVTAADYLRRRRRSQVTSQLNKHAVKL